MPDSLITILVDHKEIIIAFIPVFGIVVPFLLQKNRAVSRKIAEQKRAAYASFLESFTEIAVAILHDEEVAKESADGNPMSARDRRLLYGIKDLIEAHRAWTTTADLAKHNLAKEGELVNLIFLALRKDLLGKTKAQRERLSTLTRT